MEFLEECGRFVYEETWDCTLVAVKRRLKLAIV